MTEAIAKTPPQEVIRGLLQRSEEEIARALAQTMSPDHFLRICLTSYKRGGDYMQKANPYTFVAACMEAAQLGLKPDSILGDCYLIPRYDKKAGGYVVNFQLGYRGAMKLARRGTGVTEIAPTIRYANDFFDIDNGSARFIKHKPWHVVGATESGPLVGAFATARLQDGTVAFEYVGVDELRAAAKRSGDPRKPDPSNVWKQHFEAMCKKTAVIRLCKFLPISDDAKRAIIRDEYREAGVSRPGMQPGDEIADGSIEVLEVAQKELAPAPQTLGGI